MQLRDKLGIPGNLRAMENDHLKGEEETSTKRARPMTEGQKEIKVIHFIEENPGKILTIEQISHGVGLKSNTGAYSSLKNLMERGRIVREEVGGKRYGYRVLGKMTFRKDNSNKYQPAFAETITTDGMLQQAKDFIWENELSTEEIKGIKKFVEDKDGSSATLSDQHEDS